MSDPTFFPAGVRHAIDRLENAAEGGFTFEIANDAIILVRELRDWERRWREGTARLVPQVETKANGEGGL